MVTIILLFFPTKPLPTINPNPRSGAFVASVDSVVLLSNSLRFAVFYLYSNLSQDFFFVFHDLHTAMLLNVHNPPEQFLVVARIIWSPRFLVFFAQDQEEVVC